LKSNNQNDIKKCKDQKCDENLKTFISNKEEDQITDFKVTSYPGIEPEEDQNNNQINNKTKNVLNNKYKINTTKINSIYTNKIDKN
jgi:hypothetical protein